MTIEEIVIEYEGGASLADLGLSAGVHKSTIRRLLIGHGVKLRPAGCFPGSNRCGGIHHGWPTDFSPTDEYRHLLSPEVRERLEASR